MGTVIWEFLQTWPAPVTRYTTHYYTTHYSLLTTRLLDILTVDTVIWEFLQTWPAPVTRYTTHYSLLTTRLLDY